MKPLKMYHEHAAWFPLLTHPSEYDVDAALFADGIESAARRPVRDVLVLGSGAGNTAGHLKARYKLTLTDVSDEMLDVSRAAHPDCEHLIGDMRTVRLRRKFDAVLAEDAIMYMTTEEELAAVFATAFAHLRAGGSAVFAPDDVAETYRPNTEAGGHDGEDRSMRYLQWQMPLRPGATKREVVYAYVFREGRKSIRVDHEVHEIGVFPRGTWERLIEHAGFEDVRYQETSEGSVIFSARKPRPARKPGPARKPQPTRKSRTVRR